MVKPNFKLLAVYFQKFSCVRTEHKNLFCAMYLLNFILNIFQICEIYFSNLLMGEKTKIPEIVQNYRFTRVSYHHQQRWNSLSAFKHDPRYHLFMPQLQFFSPHSLLLTKFVKSLLIQPFKHFKTLCIVICTVCPSALCFDVTTQEQHK